MAADAMYGFHIFVSTLLVTLLISQTLAESPVVSLRKGALRGYTIERNKLTIYAFEGIPYATPPVGERRFKDPEEHEGWSGERNATAYGSICMQLDGDKIIGDEDCLFLNVYTLIPPERWGTTKLPVMVWIHGGFLQRGNSKMDVYMPDLILEKGLVFVSISYRLNVLGFLSSEDSEAPGNAGLKDVVLALKWVKENIGAFGGDCDMVTISGESAGSSVVHFLTIAPIAKGLFRAGIAMSGTAITSTKIMEEPRSTAQRLRDRVECEEGLDLIPCLRSVDAKLLVSYSMGQLDPDKMSSDVYYGVGAVLAAAAAARRGAPVFLYEFRFDSLVMAVLKVNRYNASHVAGVAHADDLPFVFALDFQPPPTEAAVRGAMVAMIANFVKTGNPTPEGSSLPKWPQYDPEDEKYAEIGEEFIIRDIPLQGRMSFWREIESSSHKRTF